jgi:hypothetical protein
MQGLTWAPFGIWSNTDIVSAVHEREAFSNMAWPVTKKMVTLDPKKTK